MLLTDTRPLEIWTIVLELLLMKGKGKRKLEQFQDNDKDIPVILTSSQMLTTGVDARNVRNIVWFGT